MANMADIIRVFKLPDWYIPSVNEILRLARYIDTERSDNESRWARYLDCSAFCDENDCFFSVAVYNQSLQHAAKIKRRSPAEIK